MEQNQLLTGTVKKNLPCQSEKILPVAFALAINGGRWHQISWLDHSSRTGHSAGERSRRVHQGPIYQQFELRAGRAHRNIGSQI